MKVTLLIISTVLLSACSSTDYTQENQERYTLFDAKGVRISEHKNFDDCNAASIRYNIRKVNDTEGINKTYQRTPVQISTETVTCRKRAQ